MRTIQSPGWQHCTVVHDPPFGQDDEAFDRCVGALDDRDGYSARLVGGPLRLVALIAAIDKGHCHRDCLEIGGVRPQLLLAGADRWRAGISVRSRSRACHYRRRYEPEAEDPPLAATSAFAAICSSGGSPKNWPSLR